MQEPEGSDGKLSRLVFPEVAESRGCEFSVANRVLNVLVAEILLNRSCIVAVVGELVAGRVTKHVWMNWKIESSLFGSSGNHWVCLHKGT